MNIKKLKICDCDKSIIRKVKIMPNNSYDGIAKAITDIISDMMERIMEKVLQSDPFIPENHHAAKPLYAALVPDEIFKGSHFERRFVTPFGSVWEKLAVVVSREMHGFCEQGKLVEGTIKSKSTGKTYAFELKGPLPNSDQTKVSKEKMFK